ncbi:MAG: DUF4260 domain-containing protein [Anaerolineaceae bacterium]|nr:DUF4260 domain-containing protein [Anaerolineaceae bacterium]
MKTLIRLEEAGEFLFSIYLFTLLPYAWWVYPLFFFAPDLAMIGYAANPRLGAITYNLIHHKAVALGLFAVGMLVHLPILSLIGVLFLGHTSLDRVLGYGLKYSDAFKHTHLGSIGQEPITNK